MYIIVVSKSSTLDVYATTCDITFEGNESQARASYAAALQQAAGDTDFDGEYELALFHVIDPAGLVRFSVHHGVNGLVYNTPQGIELTDEACFSPGDDEDEE